jgi:hypothetical protein
MMLPKSSMLALAAGLAVSLLCSAAALAQEVPGTWRLLKRELADGSEQRPPAVVGLGTWVGGYRHLNVFWHTPDGKPASIGVISQVKLDGELYTETLLAFALDDGSGKPVMYNFAQETRTAPVTREGGRIAYKLPFDPPSVVIEGDTLTATLPGVFVDYWERVK